MALWSDGTESEHARLLASVAEQLKLPLLHIRHFAELAESGQDLTKLSLIRSRATLAMTLVENYVLSLELSNSQLQLALEPVSLSSILYDVAQKLDEGARQYGVPLELQIVGRYEPVMAHREGLMAALVSLGLACIEAHPANGLNSPLRLSVHRSARGITTGVFGLTQDLAASHLQTGRMLDGRAKQPMPQFTASSTAGVFVADTLLRVMHAELRVARHQLERGLGVTLQPSRQLQFV